MQWGAQKNQTNSLNYKWSLRIIWKKTESCWQHAWVSIKIFFGLTYLLFWSMIIFTFLLLTHTIRGSKQLGALDFKPGYVRKKGAAICSYGSLEPKAKQLPQPLRGPTPSQNSPICLQHWVNRNLGQRTKGSFWLRILNTWINLRKQILLHLLYNNHTDKSVPTTNFNDRPTNMAALITFPLNSE